MTKLVSNNQGNETARLGRGMNLSRSVYQAALTDGTVEQFLRGLLPMKLQYPDFVADRLTPKHEVTELTDPGEVELWLDPRQEKSPYPTGHEVYGAMKSQKHLERSLSYGHLKWYEENRDRIPSEFKGKLIYGWASVVRSSSDWLLVPCLYCRVDRPCVHWFSLDGRWGDHEPAGLRK